MERKYLTEFGLIVYTSYKSIIPLERVYDYEDGHNYNIYVITSSPRAYFSINSLKVKKNTLSVNFEFRNKEKTEVIPVEGIALFPEFVDNDNIKYEFIKNNEFIKITAEESYIREALEKHGFDTLDYEFYDGKFIREIECGLLWQIYCHQNNIPNEYEVLYIGQAYGKGGNRNAQERLRSHSTLQKILTDFMVSRRDERLFVLLFELSVRNHFFMDGFNNNAITTDEEDEEHMGKIFNHTHSFNQIINIFEAALINYFKPPFNNRLINNFPNIKHKGYQDYFSLDYNKLIAEIDLEFENYPWIALKTEKAHLDYFDRFIEYNLFNDPNRKDMLDIFQSSKNDFL